MPEQESGTEASSKVEPGAAENKGAEGALPDLIELKSFTEMVLSEGGKAKPADEVVGMAVEVMMCDNDGV